MTFKMIKDYVQKIFFQSNNYIGHDLLTSNLSINPATTPAVIKSRQEMFAEDGIVSTTLCAIPDDENHQAQSSVPIIKTSNLVGMFSLTSMPEDIQCLRAKIVNALDSHQDDLSSNHSLKDFLVTREDDNFDEVISYNQILDNI